MSTTGKIIFGIIGAAAVGAAIGMLLAPEKGSDLRQKVKDAANDWACQLADLFAESKSELQKVKSKASKGVKEAEDRYNNIKESLA